MKTLNRLERLFEGTNPKSQKTLSIEIENVNDMDSGCIHDTLQEILNHGGIVKKIEFTANDGSKMSLMHFLNGMKPEKGKC